MNINNLLWREPKVFANSKLWLESSAVDQLREVSRLPGMLRTAGMPDLHPGKGGPVGGAFLSTDLFYPYLIGSDIGCGMGLWRMNLEARKFKPERASRLLQELDSLWEGNVQEWLAKYGVEPTEWDHTLGTPGLGNHFIEMQALDRVISPQRAQELGVDEKSIYTLVHSGSRGVGATLLRSWTDKWGSGAAHFGTSDAAEYLRSHNNAVKWAKANRALCSYRVCNLLGAQAVPLLDICHNSVVQQKIGGCDCWLHRKGAAPADCGPIVIPGSRGDLSYLVEPLGSGEPNLWSLAHGAGRKLTRSDARRKLHERYHKADLRTNRWGGKLVCGDDNLLWEEAPECYKNIESVIASLEEFQLIRVIASFRPLCTFKTGEVEKNQKTDWKRERAQARADR